MNVNEISVNLFKSFEQNEKVKHDCQYKAGRISKQDLFMDWMQGLPTAFYIADQIFYFGDAVDYVGDLLEQTEN